VAVFGKNTEADQLRQQLAAAEAHIGELRAWIEQVRGDGMGQIEADLRTAGEAVQAARAQEASLRAEVEAAQSELEVLRGAVVETRELALLQEVGIYDYAHPLEDSLEYKSELANLSAQIKAAAKGDAVTGRTDWSINGSAREGQKMARDIAKLMLRAYNAEADNAVRTVKPHTRDATKARLTKTKDTIGKLGAALHIVISNEYHRLRLREIDLTADYRYKLEVEKEEARAERERLREEAKVMREIERERAKLAKERSHYVAVVQRLEAAGDTDGLAKAQADLAEIERAVEGVETRAANIRAGYVYVISNVGAFGPDIVKIGMTRRLEPFDRVRELGDASVPFRFDCHALFFSEDAVTLENKLHVNFADRRVNLVNMRREFFYATPREVREALVAFGDHHILQFTEEPEALEWRASDPERRADLALQAAAAAQAGTDGDLSDDGADEG
jgi:hypothetical protein